MLEIRVSGVQVGCQAGVSSRFRVSLGFWTRVSLFAAALYCAASSGVGWI